MIFENVMTQIFAPQNCSKYLENKMCRYYAKRLESRGPQSKLIYCVVCFLERLCLFNDLRGVLEKRIDRYSRNELVQILLHGEYPSDTGKYAHNKQLFSYVQKFLVSTKRLVYKSKLQYNPL